MIDSYLIRSRLFLALGAPAALCPMLHAWAVIENRKFCHEFTGSLLCLTGSEKAIRVAVGRKLDALAQFSETSGYDLGFIRRGGGKSKETTSYGVFNPNRALLWIRAQLESDPDVSNPIVAIDRYTAEAITRHVPKIQKQQDPPSSKSKRLRTAKREVSGYYHQLLSHKSVALIELPDSTFSLALKLAALGFPVFAVWGVVDGVCRCPAGTECKNPGKHPIPKGWQQIATTYLLTIVKFWERHPYSNVGIATGRRMANGEYLTVIDCDSRHFGHGTLSALERGELCSLPLTREHSAGGGPHKFFTHARGFRSAPGALGQGIDVQGFGKFVIGAGMNARGLRYEVTADLPIARLPDEWADRIDAVKNKTLPLIPEGQRRAKLLSWAGGMARDGKPFELIFETLKDRRERRLERGSHSFDDDDLKGIAIYCLERAKKARVQAA